jgi:hypothetical protein
MEIDKLTKKQLKELDSLFELVSQRQKKILEILTPAIKQMDHY